MLAFARERRFSLLKTRNINTMCVHVLLCFHFRRRRLTEMWRKQIEIVARSSMNAGLGYFILVGIYHLLLLFIMSID